MLLKTSSSFKALVLFKSVLKVLLLLPFPLPFLKGLNLALRKWQLRFVTYALEIFQLLESLLLLLPASFLKFALNHESIYAFLSNVAQVLFDYTKCPILLSVLSKTKIEFVLLFRFSKISITLLERGRIKSSPFCVSGIFQIQS